MGPGIAADRKFVYDYGNDVKNAALLQTIACSW